MSEARKQSLEQLTIMSGLDVCLITPENLPSYILPESPLHPAYPYLSETHKADYLRTYFMHWYGGGYSDIKQATGSWIKPFLELEACQEYWICGYKEIEGGVAPEELQSEWGSLIGNCAYICKPQTPLTHIWFTLMNQYLTSKLEALRAHPASHPQDRSEYRTGYPIPWSGMLGQIFHRVCFAFKDRLLRTLPMPICYNYR